MDRYAVLIANGKYTAGGFARLDTPQNDIARLRETLSDKTRGNFEVECVLDETAQGVRLALVEALKRAGPDSLLLVYFSGHGAIGNDGRLYLATDDSQADVDMTMVPFAEVAGGVRHDDCERSIVVLDCCFSGRAGEELKGDDIVSLVRTEGYDPQMEDKGGTSPRPFEEGTCGKGRFLMTACSSFELAKGDHGVGMGVFTKALVDGLTGSDADALEQHPEKPQTQRITVNSLYRYVSKRLRGHNGQTPKLWVADQDGEPVTLSNIQLAGKQESPVFLSRRWKILRSDRTSLLRGVGPTYILDNGFKLLDWNALFEWLIVRETGLTRGEHIEAFLDKLENRDAVRQRSIAKFVPPDYPPVDIEELRYKSARYGLTRLTKIATQIRNLQGQRVAWSVHLNVDEVERGSLWADFEEVLANEDIWTAYATQYDRIISDYSRNKQLCRDVCGIVSGRGPYLDLGTGTGNCAMRLLKADPMGHVTAVDNNEMMLLQLDRKLKESDIDEDRVAIVKSDAVVFLREQREREQQERKIKYGSCTMLNVVFALDDPLECLRLVYDLLRPGGCLALSTSHENTNICRLFDRIHAEIFPGGDESNEALRKAYTSAFECNAKMNHIITRYSQSDAIGWVKEAGFELTAKPRIGYDGCVVILEAVKTMG
ncbi:MAG: methyltransferase [bacterium]|nr:methyltransferase [bacterium]